MPAFTATAPGKIILLGEHAVVYGQPAIAVPVTQVETRATVTPRPGGKGFWISAPAAGVDSPWDVLPPENPLRAALDGVCTTLKVRQFPAGTLKIQSTIPVAAGLGSGAAVSVALIRAVSAFLGLPLTDEQVNALAYEVEKIHHGTPSGIDNTVVTYARPVYFVKGQPVETFRVAAPFTLLIGDTGIPAPTKEAVGDVRRGWQAEPQRYERTFAALGSLAKAARQAIEGGRPERLGALMNEAHDWLCEMDVSHPKLDALVQAARAAGAQGAKLSGGGRGGNMIALAPEGMATAISLAMRNAGAVRVIASRVA
ncbi:MAG: mevalonate kinase [Anaerolineales bacterium]